MKITTLNLAGYRNWNEREANILAYLNETNSDVVFFQEAKFDREFSPLSQANFINSNLANPYPYSAASISKFYQPSHGEPFKEGLAVLSRLPIITSEALVLTKQSDDKHARIVQNVSLQVAERFVYFTNVHFSNNKYSAEQLAETLGVMKEREVQGVILGDFNIFDLSSLKNLYSPAYVASSDFTSYVSFPSENATLDYVLVPNSFDYLSLSVGEGLSDHSALTIELNI